MRRVRLVGFSAAIALAFLPASAFAQTPNLSSGETFGVFATANIANTGASSVAGDIGVGEDGEITGSAITLTSGGAVHLGDAVAIQAVSDATEVYGELRESSCSTDLTGQNLGGMTLSPGVYCFDGDAHLTGAPLTLTGTGPWIFVLEGMLTTSASVVVADEQHTCNGSDVFWAAGGDVSIGPATTFVGTILSESDVTLGSAAIVDGRALALGAASSVTLEANEVTPCSFGNPLPVHAPVKVTGGGQINVPEATSPGFANYGFNATPGDSDASGHLNYLNHVSGLHVNGTVTDVDVLTIDEDGSPDLVRFSGTCTPVSTCTFSAVVADNGEPGRDDRFGIVVVGAATDETTPHRVVRNGNIQVHLSLTTTLNRESYRHGDVMSVNLSLTPGTGSPRVDSYLVLQLPSGHLLSWTSGGFVPGLVPLARNVTPRNFRSAIAQFRIPADAPEGAYAWLTGHTAAGTMNLVSEVGIRRFSITR